MGKRGLLVGGVGAFLLLTCLGVLIWLDHQPPVLSRSPQTDPLSGYPLQVTFNPLRDRSAEHVASDFVTAMRNGRCSEQLGPWFRDYRRSYAQFICRAEGQHPMIAFQLFDREERPPLVILHYKAQRRDGGNTYIEDLFITTQRNDAGGWTVTKYGAMY